MYYITRKKTSVYVRMMYANKKYRYDICNGTEEDENEKIHNNIYSGDGACWLGD